MSIRHFTFYDPTTGAVRASGYVHASQYDHQQMNGLSKVEGESAWDTHFVENEEIKLKASMTLAVNGLTISGIPNPSTLAVDGASYEVTDGEATFSFTLPGVYEVAIKSVKFLAEKVSLTQP